MKKASALLESVLEKLAQNMISTADYKPMIPDADYKRIFMDGWEAAKEQADKIDIPAAEERGHRQGREEGYEKGLKDGYEKGLEEGLEKGKW